MVLKKFLYSMIDEKNKNIFDKININRLMSKNINY